MGELTKMESYLYDRLDMLSDEKVIIITKINNINIEMEEIISKIGEIEKDVDEAFEIFSPRVKKNDFIRDEIEKLKLNVDEHRENLARLEKHLELVNQDIYSIKDALEIEDTKDEDIYDEDYSLDKDLSLDNNTDSDENIHVRDDNLNKTSENRINILEQQELEKQRIARDLHDSTVQVLTNLVHKCEICSKILDIDKTRTKLELEIMAKTLRETIDDMRNIIYNLRPMSFDDLGIELTLKNAVAKLDSNTDMQVTFSTVGQVYELTSVVALTVLRIIQEASNNAIKYSKGEHLDIKLTFSKDNLHIEVIDDGVGFDIESKSEKNKDTNNGFGLSIMRERVFLLSGNITIESIIDKGTKISVDVPVN